jgi:hypothetical protein
MKSLKVVVGMPSMGVWCEQFGMSMLGLVSDFTAPFPGFSEQSLRFQSTKGSILARSRERIVECAMKEKATHLLFVDTDQTFPPTTLRQLLAWDKPVVACNIATKAQPSMPTARTKDGTQHGRPVFTKPSSEGLEKVWRVGTGVMLVKMKVFTYVGMEAPHFPQRWEPALQDYVGEDWAFCEKLEAAHVPIYVDHTLSKKVGHIGSLSYEHDLVPWWDHESVHSA